MSTTRRRLLTGAGLAALVLAVLSGLLFGPVTRPLEGAGAEHGAPAVDLRVLAVRPHPPSAVLLDLAAGTATSYGRTSGLPRDALHGAAITSRGEVLVWADGTVRLLAGDPPEADRRLRPLPLRRLPGVAPSVQTLPAPDGGGAWLVQPGYRHGDDVYPTLAEFVDLDHGTRHGPFELDREAWPVAAADSGLVLTDERGAGVEAGADRAGVPGRAWVVRLTRDGTLDRVAPGWAVTAGGDVVVRSTCRASWRPCELHATALDGGADRHLPAPEGAWWATVGGPEIPTDAGPLAAVSPDGRRLLAAAVSGPFPTRADGWDLHAVDLAGGSSTVVWSGGGPLPLATWSADGRWVVAAEGRDLLLLDGAGTAATPVRLREAVPADHWILAAG